MVICNLSSITLKTFLLILMSIEFFRVKHWRVERNRSSKLCQEVSCIIVLGISSWFICAHYCILLVYVVYGLTYRSDDEDEIITNVKCHYRQAEIKGCIFEIGDCAYIRVKLFASVKSANQCQSLIYSTWAVFCQIKDIWKSTFSKIKHAICYQLWLWKTENSSLFFMLSSYSQEYWDKFKILLITAAWFSLGIISYFNRDDKLLPCQLTLAYLLVAKVSHLLSCKHWTSWLSWRSKF